MQKDVIYIDTEDDITAIIGKVKAATAHIIALVPPKRIGAIQSAVNLKLVHRAAEQGDKRLVIITSNPALMSLAGSVGIPTAKNLQSKPEMTDPATVEPDGEDIIDGNSLPIGEHAAAAEKQDQVSPADGAAVIAASAVGVAAVAASKDKTDSSKGLSTAPASKSRIKVPNFDLFRKKLLIVAVVAAALSGFLVWAIMFAPRANVVVKARTSESVLNSKVAVGVRLETNLQDGTLRGVAKSVVQDASVSFDATGKKNVGEKATGTVTFSTRDTEALGTVIQSGTVLATASGLTYATNQSVTISYDNRRGATVGITATGQGTSFNGASGSVSGAPAGISASITTTTAGGTDKTVAVVQQSDVDAVADTLVKDEDSDKAKQSLQNEFGADYVIVGDSFKVDAGQAVPSPAVGEEATDGKGSLSGKVTYSIMAVNKKELAAYLDKYLQQQIDGKANQKIYDNGLKSVELKDGIGEGDNFIATISAKGKIGPNIDEANLREYAKGKKLGEIKMYVEAVPGVESADVRFSPFWVTKAPSDDSRITIEFKLNG